MQISLFIPTFNGMPLLAEVLEAVERQRGAKELERVAIDSGSEDGTVACLERHGFAVQRIDRRLFNHGATRDQGIAKTRGEVILLLTQDAIPADEHWLEHLVEAYEDADVGAAYSRQIPREDCNPFIARRLREWNAGRTEQEIQRLPDPGALEELEPMQRLRTCAFDNVAGSVRRATWKEIPFGHRRFGEDVAFGKQVVLSGRSIVYQPKSAVVHSHNRTPREEGKRIYCDHRNLSELFGLRLLPNLHACREAMNWGRREYGRIAEEMDLAPPQKRALRSWARRYAFWSALGMYLGGNHDRLARGWRRPWMSLFERWMRRGI